MNVISYVIFGDERVHWTAIPYILIANSLLYKDFNIILHHDTNALNHEVYPLLHQISEQYEKFKLIHMGEAIGFMPTIWRMAPLWDRNNNFVLCRDLDAAPMTEEVRATYYFLESGFDIHSISSYKLHTTTLMAGLCGFNSKKLRDESWFPRVFEDYRNFRGHDWVWGCDQALLSSFFYAPDKVEITRKKTLYTPIQTAPLSFAHLMAISRSPEEYTNIVVPSEANEILSLSSKIHAFAASPFTRIGSNHVAAALEIKCEMANITKHILNNNKLISKYFDY